MSGFTPIGNLLDKSLKRTGVSTHVESTLILEKFQGLCHRKWGDKIEGKVQALYVKEKVLTVACLSSVLAQEIQLNAHLFIYEINKEYKNSVTRVRFVL